MRIKDYKVRCVDDRGGQFTKGNIYNVVNGYIINDCKTMCKVTFENVNDMNRFFSSQFELHKEEGCNMVVKFKVKCIDGSGGAFTVGNVYEVNGDRISADKKSLYTDATNVQQLNNFFTSKFVKYTEPEVEIEHNVKRTIKTTENALCTFISIGDITIALPKGCPVGITVKDPTDEYSNEIGQAIAQYRMQEKLFR